MRRAGPRVGAGDRRQFPAVDGLVDGEEDDPEPRVGAEPVQHRPQRTGELGLNRGCRSPCPGRGARRSSLLWSRSTPGWICMTRPSSQDIPAIWKSMCAAKASTSPRLGSAPPRTRAYSSPAAFASIGVVSASRWP